MAKMIYKFNGTAYTIIPRKSNCWLISDEKKKNVKMHDLRIIGGKVFYAGLTDDFWGNWRHTRVYWYPVNPGMLQINDEQSKKWFIDKLTKEC